MAAPQNPDHGEAERVGPEVRKQVAQLLPEVAVGGRDLDVEDSSVSAIAKTPSESATVRS